MAIPSSQQISGADGITVPAMNTVRERRHKRYMSSPLIRPEKVNEDMEEQKTSAFKSRDSVEMKMIKDLLFGSVGNKTNKKRNNQDSNTMDSERTPFQEMERRSTLFTVSQWTPLPSELMSLASVFTLFAKLRVQGQHHLPRDGPCLIIVNHALGHGFDVPMMVYILRRLCNLQRVRVLVSPSHFNWPLWSDLAYYLGAVPRSHELCEQLMMEKENIIMFAAKKKRTGMIWDDSRSMYLDLVHKYDYKLVPAVCVSDEDVINMVYDIRDSSSRSKRSNNNNRNKQKSEVIPGYDTEGDTDATDNEEEESMATFKTIRSRLRGGYRTQYHLRFSFETIFKSYFSLCFIFSHFSVFWY